MATGNESHHSVYAFIMAGGVGSRLWPRSRKSSPKQFLDLISSQTMLQDAYERLQPAIPAEHILIGVGADYVPAVLEQLPDLALENIVVEPAGRGTAPAIGLGALHIEARDPDGVMVVVTADHHIGDRARFRQVLMAAAETAAEGHLVTLGITPTFASTGYGYIRRGELLHQKSGFDVYRAIRFTEKPDPTMAQAFLDSGMYCWNSGMFVWQVRTIREEFERQMPELHEQLVEIQGALGSEEEKQVLERVWSQVEKETIDYGIMENARDVAVISACIGWNDIGSWKTLMELLDADSSGNVVEGELIGVDTTHTLVYSPKKLVATIGVHDLVIVETEDALLVCPLDRCQEVRKIVDTLSQRQRDDLL